MTCRMCSVALAKQSTHQIGIGELVTSNDPEAVIVTYSLGSCIGLAIYDPVLRIGGMMHSQPSPVQSGSERISQKSSPLY